MPFTPLTPFTQPSESFSPSPLGSASFQSASSTSNGTFSFNTGTTTTATSVHSGNDSDRGTSTGATNTLNTNKMESTNATNDEHGIGLSNPKMSQASRRMLDLVNGLHSTGVQVDIDLPRIVVVGNQSAGKSSLIESISGITLPRAGGTCTRCPTECRLSRSDSPWKCVVSLSITTDSKGQPLGQSKNEPFGPTIYNKQEVEDRIRRAQLAILNPHKPIASFLREDNNDSDSLDSTIDVDDLFEDAPASLTFSMNCVSLAISGPDVADLTFVDLPGLIASVGQQGNPADIKLVKGLVTSYIKKPNCIILLTVACETDFENQGAHELARTYDPEGKRTIGVLTKPDRISVGEESPWLRFIRNEKETLENGWFCVKQPSSSDLKEHWTWEEARRKEDEFFASTAPWNELDGLYAKYLRTGNLVERLSSILSNLIAKRLPEIREEIEHMIRKTREQIVLLPKPPPKNALNEIARLIKDFDSSLRMHIEGVPDKEGIIQQIRIPSNHFRSVIRGTAPEFRPFSKSQGEKVPEFNKPKGEHVGVFGSLGKPQVVFEELPPQTAIEEVPRPPSLSDWKTPEGPQASDRTTSDAFKPVEEPEVWPSSSGRKSKKKSAMKLATKAMWDQPNEKSEVKEQGSFALDWGQPEFKPPQINEELTKPQITIKTLAEPEFLAHEEENLIEGFDNLGKNGLIYIDEVYQRMEESRTRELPGYFPFIVQREYIKEALAKWDRPAIKLCDEVFAILVKCVRQLVREHFESFGQGTLEHQIRLIMHEHLSQCLSEAKKKIEWLMKIQCDPFTLNNHYLVDYKVKFLTYYRRVRQDSKKYDSNLGGKHGLFDSFLAAEAAPTDPAVAHALSALAKLGYHGLKPDDLGKLLGHQNMEPAMEVMATVRAYFQVAYKRFIDTIPMAIDYELVRGGGQDIFQLLWARLGLDGPRAREMCDDYAQEGLQVANRREELHKKLERLTEATRRLISIG